MLAEKNRSENAILESHRLIGLFANWLGDFSRSGKHFDIVRELFNPAKRHELALFYGQDHEMSGHALQSVTLAALGYLDRARSNVDAAIAASLRSDHVFSQAYALAIPLITFFYMRDLDRIETATAKTISFCTEHRIAYYLAYGPIAKGYMLAWRGDLDAGIAQMRDGIAEYRATGSGVLLPLFQTMLAEMLIARGELDDVAALLDRSTDQCERWGEAHYQAETIRVRGEMHRRAGDDDAGEACFRDAIAFAQGQEAKLFELRAVISLARLWQGHGKTKEAHDLLAPVYGWFTEGFDTADLKEANLLLRELQ